MSAEYLDLFEDLAPPPGGAERFARQLDELTAAAASPPMRVQVLGVAACLVVAALAAGVWLREPEPRPFTADSPAAIDIYDAPEFDRLLGRTRPPAELTVRLGAEVAAVTQLETTNEKVRITASTERRDPLGTRLARKVTGRTRKARRQP